jgi:hypothetical protein
MKHFCIVQFIVPHEHSFNSQLFAPIEHSLTIQTKCFLESFYAQLDYLADFVSFLIDKNSCLESKSFK